VHADGTRQLGGESRLTQTNAVLTRDAPAEDTVGSIFLWVPAQWKVGGRLHTGSVPAAAGMRAGTSVGIWLDAAGKVQQPPLTAAQLSARTVLAAVSAPLAVALAMLVAWSGLRWLLDRRRLAAWDESWSIVGPSWTR